MKKIGILMALAMMIALVSCDKEEETVYVNGDYSAEDAEFHYGYKAFTNVTIENDNQVSVQFDYVDDAGGLKSQTTAEEYPMDPHPSVWCRTLETQLMAVDIVAYTEIDGITGATSGSVAADELFQLILDAAKTGDTSKQIRPAE